MSFEFSEQMLNGLYEDWLCFDVDGSLLSCSPLLKRNWEEQGILRTAGHARDFFELTPDNSEAFFKAWIGSVRGGATSIRLRLSGIEKGELLFTFMPQFGSDACVSSVVAGSIRHCLPVFEIENAGDFAVSERVLEKITGLQDLYRDATAAKDKLEKALAASREEIRAAKGESEAKTEFLANMSHEIRTPMNAVIGFCELLSSTDLKDSQIEYVDAISHSGQLLIKLIGQVLDYSKIESGHLKLESEAFSLEDLLMEVQAMIGSLGLDKKVSFKVDSSGVSDETLVGDPTRVKQVLINLLSNAIKFTRKGSILLSATTERGAKSGFLTFRARVEDTGIGIEEEYIDSLFCPFAQAHARIAQKYGGTGLGLAICKQLCSAMQGDVWIERSVLGEGSVFAFELQLARKSVGKRSGVVVDAVVSKPSYKELTDIAVSNAAREAPLRLLVVDDNPNNLLVTSKLSRHLGYMADTVTNGVDALRKLKDGEYDIVLMDVRMAPINGIETTRLIRNGEAGDRSSAAYIIAVTAHALQGDKEKCLESGMNDYLSKPLTLERLEQSLKRARTELSLD